MTFVGSGIGQNGILNLHYDILEKKKDNLTTGRNATNGVDVVNGSMNSEKNKIHGNNSLANILGEGIHGEGRYSQISSK